MKHTNQLLALALGLSTACPASPVVAADNLWVESEHSADVEGSNGSWTPTPPLEKQRGWGIAGPGVAPEWTQGGESEWTSIAAHPQENSATSRYSVEVPAAGSYRVWVRYADYQNKKEAFRVRVNQGGKVVFNHVYGDSAILPEDDEVKLMWGWAFGWGMAEADLQAGAAELQLVVDAPSEARRHVDTMLITDDKAFRPLLREKPPFHYWAPLEAYRTNRPAQVPALAAPAADWNAPAQWRTPPLAGRDFQMLMNTPVTFWKQDGIAAEKRVLYPFFVGHGGAVEKAFIEQYGGQKDVPIWSSKLVVPVIYLTSLPEFLSDDSPFLAWLRQTKSPFGILVNYASSDFGAKGPMLGRNLAALKEQFVGYMSGENIAYTNTVDYPHQLPAAVIGKATHRQQILDQHRDLLTPALAKKWTSAYGTPVAGNVWPDMMSALSTDMDAYVHALAAWGERTVGYEPSAAQLSHAMHWGFIRGAARQFGRNWVLYHAANFGDTATTFVAGQNIAGPYTNYYHSHYDGFSGTGMVWYRKAYFSAYMAGAAGIYIEQGFDQYHIPSPGPERVELSPLGRITDEFMRFAEKYPDRGVPYTPIAFLLDSGHGWYHYENEAGALGVAAKRNPQVLSYSRHDAMIRDLMNIAYYPLPRVEGEPAASPRQNFVNAPLGNVFDVLVTSSVPKADEIVNNYRGIVLSGEVRLTAEWGTALRDFVQRGGTLVVTDDQVQGPGAAVLELPADEGKYTTSNRVLWKLGETGEGQSLTSNTYRYRQNAPEGTPLATAGDGKPIAVQRTVGQGKIIWIGIPKGLGLDNRATPLMSKIMLHLRQGLLPIEVRGDVEYYLNRNQTGWVVTLFNNRGNYKSQHGLGIPRREETAPVTVSTNLAVTKATEWTENGSLDVKADGAARTIALVIPAGGIRIIHLVTP